MTPILIETSNTLCSLIAELRVARALIKDQVRGINDPKYDLVKEWDRVISQAESHLKAFRQLDLP